MIKNINYKGQLAPGELEKVRFPKDRSTPYQVVFDVKFTDNNARSKFLVFCSGKCRLMGLQRPLRTTDRLPYLTDQMTVQSITLVHDLGKDINLLEVARKLPPKSFCFEQELFPAMRLTKFNPLCVNVFSSGKVVIMGVKDFSFGNLISDITEFLKYYN